MSIKCYILDDEPLAIKVIEKFLSEFPEFILIGTQTDPVVALKELDENEVDLLYLDINMPKIAGLELLELTERQPHVVFTTAYGEHALESFKYRVIDYLVKPISFSRFTKSIQKTKSVLDIRHQAEQKGKAKSFFLKDGKGVKQVTVDEVRYIKTEGDYLVFFCESRRIVVHSSMKKMEEELSEYPFLRVHQSFMVNVKFIKGFAGAELAINDKSIPVGRTYRSNLVKFFHDGSISRSQRNSG